MTKFCQLLRFRKIIIKVCLKLFCSKPTVCTPLPRQYLSYIHANFIGFCSKSFLSTYTLNIVRGYIYTTILEMTSNQFRSVWVTMIIVSYAHAFLWKYVLWMSSRRHCAVLSCEISVLEVVCVIILPRLYMSVTLCISTSFVFDDNLHLQVCSFLWYYGKLFKIRVIFSRLLNFYLCLAYWIC